MKKILGMVLIFCLFMIPQAQADFDVGGKSAMLLCGETGQVLFEKNPHEPMEPASITKIMSMLLIHEAILNEELSYDDMVTISRHAQSMYGSQIFLEAGERVNVWDLQLAVAIASANDATVALAEYLSGSEEAFVGLMNRRAQELGMNDTNFVNSTGLPPAAGQGEHITTAHDIAKMSLEFIQHPALLEKTSIWVDYLQLSGREAMLVNHNRLVRHYPGVDGIKTGHTSSAGYCLAATAVRDDRRFIAIIMNTESAEERQEEITRLLDFAFRAFRREPVKEQGELVGEIEILTARGKTVEVYAADDLKPYIRRGQPEGVRVEKNIFDEDAPFEANQVIGNLRAYQGDVFLAEVDLLVTEDVSRANFLAVLWRRIISFFQNLLRP